MRERFGDKTPSWHSSPAQRCVASGRAFWEGWGEKNPELVDSYDRERAFKSWDAKSGPYRDYVAGFRSGENVKFRDKARSVSASTAALWAKLGVTEGDECLRLYWCTYACSLLDCEKFSEKRAMTSRLSQADMSLIKDLGRWVWDLRFFQGGFAEFLGGDLLDLVNNHPREEKNAFFRLFSGHDYSMLSALAAAGAEAYESRVFSFGAYLIVEHFDVYDVWRVNAAPFEEEEEAEEVLQEPNCQGFWRHSLAVVSATEKHPFLRQLLDGSLAKGPFVEYVTQDALYLSDFAKALRLLAKNARNDAQTAALDAFAEGAEVAEKTLHHSFFKKWAVDDSDASQKPYCLLYTSFMLAKVALEPQAAGLAALLPCFWVYGHVGALLYDRRAEYSNRAPEYDEWICMYGGDDFLDAVARYRALVEHAARLADPALRATMRANFHTCCVLEFLFWQAPIQPEIDWPDFSSSSS